MAKEWIENLAQDIKQKNREAATEYGIAQHHAGVVTDKGLPFFISFTTCLHQNVDELRGQLQGHVTASDTLIETPTPAEIKLSRARFPWFDARIIYRDDTIVLDYAKGPGVAANPSLDRKTCHFAFQVDQDDTLTLQQAFSDRPQHFHQPEELAQHITQLLFHV